MNEVGSFSWRSRAWWLVDSVTRCGLTACRLTGPVGETPEPELRRNARSDLQTQPAAALCCWSEDNPAFVSCQTALEKSYYGICKPRMGVSPATKYEIALSTGQKFSLPNDISLELKS